MVATALLKFTQGTHAGSPGCALIVSPGVAVTIENTNNAGVQSYRIELLYAPPGTSQQILPGVQSPTILAQGNGVPSATITPEADYYGCYRVRLTVWAGASYTGQSDVDIRNIAVPTPNNKFIKPPYQRFPDPLPVTGEGRTGEKPEELNFESLRWGWSGPEYYTGSYPFRLLNATIDYLDDVATTGSLVSASTKGTVSAFYEEGYPHVLVSDGETAGGVWSKLDYSTANYLFSAAALPPSKIYSGGATAGQLLSWNGTAWSPVDAPSTVPTLVTSEDQGGVYYFPTEGYPHMLVSDGETYGGVWSKMTNTLADGLFADAALPLSKIYGGGATSGQMLSWSGTAWSPVDAPAGSLVDGEYDGIVSYFPTAGYPHVLVSDGETYGGVWSKISYEVAADLIDNNAIAPSAIASGGASYGQVLTWDGSYWSSSYAPEELINGTDTGQLAFWSQTDGYWKTTEYYPGTYYVPSWTGTDWDFVSPSTFAPPLVSYTYDGIANYFPEASYYLFGSDGSTYGGVWVRNIDSFLDYKGLSVDRLYGEYDRRVLSAYDGYGEWVDTLREIKNVTFISEYNIGSSGSSKAIDWENGSRQRITINAATVTLSFDNAPSGCSTLVLRVIQDATGGRSITWPTNTRAASGTVSVGTTAGRSSIIYIHWDGTNYYVVASAVNIPDTQATTTLV